jgi:hypothetical protein
MTAGKTALTAVQTAVMAALANDATLMAAAPGGVWDYVPDEPTWPYVCLEDIDEAANDTFGNGTGSQGRVVNLTFTVFSNYAGRSEQFTILDHLVRVLRYTTLTIAGWTHMQTVHTGSKAVSPFDMGNVRAGSTMVTFAVWVREG